MVAPPVEQPVKINELDEFLMIDSPEQLALFDVDDYVRLPVEEASEELSAVLIDAPIVRFITDYNARVE